MVLRVQIELTVEQVQQILDLAIQVTEGSLTEKTNVESEVDALHRALASLPSDSFTESMAKSLVLMANAATDESWKLHPEERRWFLLAVMYFNACSENSNEEMRRTKLIAASIVASVTAAEHRHELEAYADYLDYKAAAKDDFVDRESWLKARTEELLERMQSRRKRGEAGLFNFHLRTGSTGPRGNENI